MTICHVIRQLYRHTKLISWLFASYLLWLHLDVERLGEGGAASAHNVRALELRLEQLLAHPLVLPEGDAVLVPGVALDRVVAGQQAR